MDFSEIVFGVDSEGWFDSKKSVKQLCRLSVKMCCRCHHRRQDDRVLGVC